MFECLLQRYKSAAACHRDTGSGCSRPGRHSAWHKILLEEAAISSITELPELTEDWEWTLGGHNRTLCTRTQEKGTVTPQETVPDLPVCVRESLVKVWVCGGLLQGWGHRL